MSSLSFVAAYLREADGRPTFVAISRAHTLPAAFWMFWGPDDPALPSNIRFLNASSHELTLRALQDSQCMAATGMWMAHNLAAVDTAA